MDEQRIAPRSKKQATGGNIMEKIRPKGSGGGENADIQNEDAADNEAEEEGEDEQMEENNGGQKSADHEGDDD